MPAMREENEDLLDLALSVGCSMDLESMLRNVASAVMGRWGVTGMAVLAHSLEGDRRGTKQVFAEPCDLEAGSDALGRLEAWSSAENIIGVCRVHEAFRVGDRHAQAFTLPEYGLLILIGVLPLEPTVVQSLKPICVKLAEACRTCDVAAGLARSRQYLQTTLNSIGDAVIATDECGAVAFLNPIAESLTGWRSTQATGAQLETVFNIVNARTDLPVENPVRKVLQDGRIVGLANHTKLLARDGAEYQIADSAAPIVDDSGHVAGVVMVFRDVTEEYAAQERLAQSEARFRTLFSKSADAQLLLVDGLIADCNEASLSMFRASREEIVGLPPDRLSPEFQPNGMRSSEAAAIEVEKAFASSSARFEWNHNRMDGTTFWADVTATAIPMGAHRVLLGTLRDITERLRTEEQLRESESRLRQIAETIEDVFWITDWTTHHILFASHAYEQIWGRPLQDLYDSPEDWAGAIHPEDRQRAWTRFIELGESGVYEEEYRILRPDGTQRWIRDRGFPVRDDKGLIYRVVGIAQDITQRKQAEAERAQLEAELRHAQKMEAIGQLASGVAHDFNNLLTVIAAHTELARMRATQDPRIAESLSAVQEAARQAAGVTRSLLTFACKVPLSRRPVNLAVAMERASRMLQRSLPSSIELTVSMACEPTPWVNADETQMQQVLLNLAVNARDAMPQGGSLHVSLRATGGTPTGDLSQSPSVQLVVRDTGVGMPQEVLSHIFDPYFTTKPHGQGTGLGLSIIHGIVTDHKGTIEVDSKVGVGSTFTIVLPRLSDKDLEAPEPQTTMLPTGQGEMMLLAEDNEQVRAIMADTLASLGYRVAQAADGQALLECAERYGDGIHLFVIDVGLPKRSGLDCLRSLRADGVTTPAIVITASVDTDLPDPIDPYTTLLRKPLNAADLAGQVHKILLRQRGEEPAKP